MRLDAVISMLAAGENPYLQKAGIVCMGCSEDHYKALTPIANWHYNYKLWPSPNFPLDWANEHDVEYIAMIAKKNVKFPDGSFCHMDAWQVENNPKKWRLCTVDELVDLLEDTKSKVRTEYLMMFNEAYKDTETKPWKWQDPADVVEHWRHYFQPIAEKTGLKLVSPTTAKEDEKLEWTADIIKHCWAHREDPEFPCDVEQLSAWSIHDYQCKEKRFRRHYGNEQWYKDLAAHMVGEGFEGKDWFEFVRTRPMWFTETNCNWDGGEDKMPDEHAGCRRITGTAENKKFGHGSLMEQALTPEVDRIFWWSIWQPNERDREATDRSFALNEDGSYTAIGRALVNGLDPELAQCDA